MINIDLSKPAFVIKGGRLAGAFFWDKSELFQGALSDAPNVPIMLIYSSGRDIDLGPLKGDPLIIRKRLHS